MVSYLAFRLRGEKWRNAVMRSFICYRRALEKTETYHLRSIDQKLGVSSTGRGTGTLTRC